MRDVLVLGGGGIKGSFQAGAIRAVVESGFHPSAIYGVSVGALNGSFLANRAGRETLQAAGAPIDWDVEWKRIADELVIFWCDKITKPTDIFQRRDHAEVLLKSALRNFTGMVTTDRLRKLVRAEINPDWMRASPVHFRAGVVDLQNGCYKSAGIGDGDIHKHIMASSAIPGIMPAEIIEGRAYVDGGLRHVVPLADALADGAAQRVVCIACQPHAISAAPALNTKNFLHYIDRIMEIITDETVANDVQPLPACNDVPIKMIRPRQTLDVSMLNFTKKDITQMISLGEQAAAEVMKTPWD